MGRSPMPAYQLRNDFSLCPYESWRRLIALQKGKSTRISAGFPRLTSVARCGARQGTRRGIRPFPRYAGSRRRYDAPDRRHSFAGRLFVAGPYDRPGSVASCRLCRPGSSARAPSFSQARQGGESNVMTKWVYGFGNGKADGRADMRNLLGGKGANLAEMSVLGLPVPPGFTITTELCSHYYDNGRTYPDELKTQVQAALGAIESVVGAKFGDKTNPLLVSVRSGARASMPGMMDTVLNLGLNDETVSGLAVRTGDERFAYDSYRRFIQMYGDVVLGVEHYRFEDELEGIKRERGVSLDTELTAQDLQTLVERYKAVVETDLGHPFPQDPEDQLWGAVGAVFGSWMN